MILPDDDDLERNRRRVLDRVTAIEVSDFLAVQGEWPNRVGRGGPTVPAGAPSWRRAACGYGRWAMAACLRATKFLGDRVAKWWAETALSAKNVVKTTDGRRTADMCGAQADVRFVPKADSCSAANRVAIRAFAVVRHSGVACVLQAKFDHR